MKEVFSQIHRSSKTVLIIGWSIIVFMLAASTVLYIGAGNVFDYYSAVEVSEKLLASVRPVCLVVCASCLTIEYFIKKKNC